MNAHQTNPHAKAAREWIGTPYHHQASLRGVGCDCLGLLRGVWREVEGAEPEAAPGYTPDWGEASGAETLLAAAKRHLNPCFDGPVRAGDVLVFRMRAGSVAKHVGIATAEDRFVHSQEGAGVREVPLHDWWRRRIAARFTFPSKD